MQNSEERDFREGLIYDAYVKEFDSNFWAGDTAILLFDTVRNAVKVGDTALAGHVSSYSQYLYGDFEFAIILDSVTPDTTTDCGRYFGLRNMGDTLNRGAAYFDLSYDTTATDSSPDTTHFAAVVYSEAGTRYRRFVTWDTSWAGGRTTRFRISWEPNGYKFLVNDTVVESISEGRDSNGTEVLINTTIPQALRISKSSIDTTDTSPMAFKSVLVRNARKII